MSSAVAPNTTAKDLRPARERLPDAVRSYRRLYYLLIGISVLLLGLVVLYLFLWNNETKVFHHPLPDNYALNGAMAVSRSGKTVAVVVYRPSDSSNFVLVSTDNGRHFSEIAMNPRGADRAIYSLAIAPDDQTVVAWGATTLYVRKAGTDSFHTLQYTPVDPVSQQLRGVVFSNISDSAFVFSDEMVVGFDYKRCDSLALGSFADLTHYQSLAIGRKSNLFAGIASGTNATVAFADAHPDFRQRQSFTHFQSLSILEGINPYSSPARPDTSATMGVPTR